MITARAKDFAVKFLRSESAWLETQVFGLRVVNYVTSLTKIGQTYCMTIGERRQMFTNWPNLEQCWINCDVGQTDQKPS